jgi:hypothetical protein
MHTGLAVEIPFSLQRRIQAALLPDQGGDSEGDGCGVCMGTGSTCSLMLSSDFGVLGAGILYPG